MNAIHHITIILNVEDLCKIRPANPGVEIVKKSGKRIMPGLAAKRAWMHFNLKIEEVKIIYKCCFLKNYSLKKHSET